MVSFGYFTDKVVWEGSFSSKAVRALSTFVVFVGHFRNEAAEVMRALII